MIVVGDFYGTQLPDVLQLGCGGACETLGEDDPVNAFYGGKCC